MTDPQSKEQCAPPDAAAPPGVTGTADSSGAGTLTSKQSIEERCRWNCAWKGGGPCLAEDCPRRKESVTSNPQLPELLRAAERRVNAHVFRTGGDGSLASIPAKPDRDVDLLLMRAADEIERLQREVDKWQPRLIESDRLVGRLRAALEDLLDEMAEDTGQRHHRDKYRVYQITPSVVEDAREALGPAHETSGDRT